jgi:hypothetical protein
MALAYPPLSSLSVEVETAIPVAGTTTAAFLGDSSSGLVVDPVTILDVRSYAEAFGRARNDSALAGAVAGFFANGGSKAIICSVGRSDEEVDRNARLSEALRRLESFPDIGLVCAPGSTEAAAHDLILFHCESSRQRFAVLDGPSSLDSGGVRRLARPRDSAFGACYFPWLYVREAGYGDRCVPPSGHIAGMLARLELEGSIHRAPTNQLLRSVTGVAQVISRADQDALNLRGINCLRSLGERGLRVFGATTLAADVVWKPIAARRLASLIERSITAGVRRFMPLVRIDEVASVAVKEVRALLHGLQESGAVMASPDQEPFTVDCRIDGDPASLVCGIGFSMGLDRPAIPLTVTLPLAVFGAEAPARAHEKAG